MLGNHIFDSNFEVILADTPESRAIHYNIRYQVYCEEMGFEDKHNYPNEQESDHWDDQSVHFLVRDKYLGHWVGALRLVSHKGRPFPLETHCQLDEPLNFQQYQHSVELSRLCVLKEVRRFSARRLTAQGLLGHTSKTIEGSNVTLLRPHKNLGLTVMWGLLRAAASYCKDYNINDLYLLIAPALAFSIRKEKFSLNQVGEACEHRGQRIPFQWEIENVLANSLWQNDYQAEFSHYSSKFGQDVAYRKLA